MFIPLVVLRLVALSSVPLRVTVLWCVVLLLLHDRYDMSLFQCAQGTRGIEASQRHVRLCVHVACFMHVHEFELPLQPMCHSKICLRACLCAVCAV